MENYLSTPSSTVLAWDDIKLLCKNKEMWPTAIQLGSEEKQEGTLRYSTRLSETGGLGLCDNNITKREMLAWTDRAMETRRRCESALADLEHRAEYDVRQYDECNVIMSSFEEVADDAEMLIDAIGTRPLDREISASSMDDISPEQDLFEETYSGLMDCYGRAKAFIMRREKRTECDLRLFRPVM